MGKAKGVRPDRSVRRKLSKYEKQSIKFWSAELENRRLALFLTTLKEDLSRQGESPAVDRLLERCEKRAGFDNPKLAGEAITNFLHLNEKVGSGEFPVSLDTEVASNARLFIVTALERYTASNVFDSIQCNLDLTHMLSLWRYGPGASVGCEGTHFAEKITQRVVSCTEEAAPYFKLLRLLNPHTRLFDETVGTVIEYVGGSSLTTVPKNQDTHRTIGTEPLANMSLQLAAGAYIEGTLRYLGIDLVNQQEKNKNLANLGSINNGLATIDLKSASDLITPALIEQLWPREWLEIFTAFRSPGIKPPFYDKFIKLHMMSTMGNGFTFPMMTLTLLALIYGFNAKNKLGTVLRVDLSCHAVFGDDIICPSSSYDGICEVLVSAGLLVNKEKSFNDGPFRESCGGDYYLGELITPCYIEHLSNDMEIYVAINKVVRWSVKHRTWLAPCLMKLIRMLRGPILLVPEWESPDSGILTQYAPHRYKKLVYEKVDVVLRNQDLVMLSVIGGYVTSRGDGAIMFTPRVPQGTVSNIIVEKARYSKSFLDGHAAEFFSMNESQDAARVIAAIIS